MTLTSLMLLLLSASAFLDAEGAPSNPSELVPVPLYKAQLESSGRIINGETARKGQFPHQIGMYMNGNFRCGGAIISQRHILTAAHCIVDPATYTIKVGSVKRGDGQTYAVRRVIAHPGYNPNNNYVNDIGLMELASPLALNEYVKIIPLERSAAQPGQAVTTSGWGMTDPDDPESLATILQYLQTNIVSNVPWPQHPGQIGAYAVHTKGICSGDSGGPLITAQRTLIGVNSFVYPKCGHSGQPDGFANVPYYVDWIQQNMQ